jgi:cytochrome c2
MKFVGFLVLLFLSITQLYATPVDPAEGKQIFMSRCASCHAVATNVVGPALKGVDQRRSEEWIVNFVHSSQTVIQSGDTTAINLYNHFNQTRMPDHKDLTRENILGIIAFIRTESNKAGDASLSSRVSDDHTPYLGKSSLLHQIIYLDIPGKHRPLSFTEPYPWFLIGGVVFILIGTLCLVVRLNQYMDKSFKHTNEQ